MPEITIQNFLLHFSSKFNQAISFPITRKPVYFASTVNLLSDGLWRWREMCSSLFQLAFSIVTANLQRVLTKLNKKPNNLFKVMELIKNAGKDTEEGIYMRGKKRKVRF